MPTPDDLPDDDALFGESLEWERLSGRPRSEFSRAALHRLSREEQRRYRRQHAYGLPVVAAAVIAFVVLWALMSP